MENLVQFACDHHDYARWIFILLILLAGLNIPISIDLVILSAGALSSTCAAEEIPSIFLPVYAACCVSAWESYWIGRLIGPRLYHFPWFRHILSLKRIETLHYYYEKFGFLTFVCGRFIPGGVRNALFMTSGLGKMPFYKFALRDAFGCFLSCAFLFYLGHLFGRNYQTLLLYFKRYNLIVVALIAVLIGSYIIYSLFKKLLSRSLGKNE